MILRTLMWTLITFAVIAALWFWYEGSWDHRLFSASPGCTCANLSAGQANAWLHAHSETQVLDVRSAGEYARGALPGAVNISIGDPAFEAKAGTLDKNKPVLVYCAGGYRSRKAVAVLKELGFRNIQHIHRGYMSWKPDARP